MYKKTMALLMALVTVACLIPLPRAEADFENTYTLTGNQRKDILGVAVTQLEYREGPHGKEECGNDTKYGDWYGLPYNEWCAMFVSWCARQADISEDILQNSCRAGPGKENFNIACFPGTEYTPQPGDLFFKADYTHVGLVYEVREDTVITIEGNVNYEGTSEEDGFTVTFLERNTAELLFGVPEYEGCDPCGATGGEHQYTRKHDESHPHANHFECDACGDLYYTGSYAQVTDCAECMSCGCSTAYAGLYKVVDVDNFLVLRQGHATYTERKSTAELDEVVEVLAGNGSWAHVVWGPEVYYGSMEYLERYVPAPGNMTADGGEFVSGDTATVTWDPSRTATAYQIRVLRDGEQIYSEDLGEYRRFVLENMVPGDYEVYVTASFAGAVSEPGMLRFQVLDVYEVQYDCMGGTAGPEPQQKIQDRPLTLSGGIPEREGFCFIGWNDDPQAGYARYQPGDLLEKNGDTTFYAHWRGVDAVPEALEIVKPAEKQLYFVGDELDTTGLVLMLRYSDGSAKRLTDGYEISGFRSDQAGDVTVTLTCEGVTASYPVSVIAYLPGDMDMNRSIDKEDVMQLLWHISFPDMFPIEVPGDFTGEGRVDKDDVMQLLWHISFPELFPLN